MNRENEIKKILDSKLKNNDIYLVDVILSYLKENCYICWQKKFSRDMFKCYCDPKNCRSLYMNICQSCIIIFNFKKCNKCYIYADKEKCYRIGEMYLCGCCACSGYLDFRE